MCFQDVIKYLRIKSATGNRAIKFVMELSLKCQYESDFDILKNIDLYQK